MAIMILLLLIAMLVVFMYSMIITFKRADKRAEDIKEHDKTFKK